MKKIILILLFAQCTYNISAAQAASSNNDSLTDSFVLLSLDQEIDSFVEMVKQIINQINDYKNQDKNLITLDFLDRFATFKQKIKFFQDQIKQQDNNPLQAQASALDKLDQELNSKITDESMPWVKGKIIFAQLSPELIEQYKQYNQEKYLTDIVNLIWYFYYLAALEGKSFEEGTFLINCNQSNLIVDFLSAYSASYHRISSHFPEMKIQQFGIDIPQAQRTYLMFPPFMKFHILYGKISEDEIFIKPEDHGIGDIKDFALHSISYIQSLHRRFLGSESAESRKERIPANITTAWKILTKLLINETNNKLPADFPKINNDLIKFYEQFGIRGMIRFINSAFMEDQVLTSSQREAKKEFIKQVEKFENLYLRRGNEVILTNKDFKIINIDEAKSKLEQEYKEQELLEIEQFEQKLKERLKNLRTQLKEKERKETERLEQKIEYNIRQKELILQQAINKAKDRFKDIERFETIRLEHELKKNEWERQDIQKFASFPDRNLKLFIEPNKLNESYEGFIRQYLNALQDHKFKLANYILKTLNEIAYTKEGYANKFTFIKKYLEKEGLSAKEIYELLENKK
ncbi:MAG: hypothetical protein P4L22_01305 [Candidatus Babeliales bacterium]|nr:hypothetical protein [Candidatus Babeliales bacterium]